MFIHFSEFPGGGAAPRFENAVEIGEIIKPATVANLADIQVCTH